MNKIVREHYPAARLPDDLRGEFGLEAEVTVTIEQSSGAIAHSSSADGPVQRAQERRAELNESDNMPGPVRGVTGEPQTRGSLENARATAIANLLEHRKLLQPSASDAVERVRALRDEWDA